MSKLPPAPRSPLSLDPSPRLTPSWFAPGGMLLALLACRAPEAGADLLQLQAGAGDSRPEQTVSGDEAAAETEELIRAEAAELIAAGEYERARGRIDLLLLGRELERARELLAIGEPADALVCVDRALALSSQHHEAHWLKAAGSLRLAEAGIARRATATLIEGSLQDALEHYGACARETPSAAFGASRAALLLRSTEEAVRWARAGREALLEDPALAAADALGRRPGALAGEGEMAEAHRPHRIVAEALLRAYVEAKSAADAGEEPREDPAQLMAEVEEALGHLLGRRPDSAWAWRSLSDLYEWEQRYDLAHARLLSAVERVPGDAGLLRRLARVVRSSQGTRGRHRDLRALRVAQPEPAPRTLAPGGGALRAGAGAHVPTGGPGELRARAVPPGGGRLRALPPALPDRHEHLPRLRGGVPQRARLVRLLRRDDLETAQREFLSMNELFEGGITWSLEDRLQSGVLGLAFVGDQYNRRQDWLAAGEAFEAAHRFEPEDATWANNAGFFLRDAAVELEREGKRLCRAAAGKVTDEAALAEIRSLAGLPAEVAGSAGEGDLWRPQRRSACSARAPSWRAAGWPTRPPRPSTPTTCVP